MDENKFREAVNEALLPVFMRIDARTEEANEIVDRVCQAVEDRLQTRLNQYHAHLSELLDEKFKKAGNQVLELRRSRGS